jgi:hypothetical protein
MKIRNLTLAIISSCCLLSSCKNVPVIVIPARSSELINLAAREVKRYTYLVNGVVPEINDRISPEDVTNDVIIISPANSELIKSFPLIEAFADSVRNLKKDGFGIKTILNKNVKMLLITGNTELGTLYGAYQYAEKLGVRFYAHGDVIPDGKHRFSIPDISEMSSPLFETRGLQPFHDFPEGPDWWNSDDYKSIFTQMVKMKMNFFGLHTYPEGGVGPEPTVWIGSKNDINPDGTVKFSYPARYFTTTGDTPWSYNLRKTSDYSFGTGRLFETDSYGSEIMEGFSPTPPVASGHGYTPEYEWKIEPQLQISDDGWNKLMNRTGSFFNNVFSYGRSLGIKMCVGTETPLIIPRKVKQHLIETGIDTTERKLRQKLYEGIFERIKLSYPIDYYWFWTPEDWTWGGNNQKHLEQTRLDLEAAIAAAEDVKAPFSLATCGWVLGPVQDRAMFDKFLPQSWAMSCINREVGFSPVEPGFAKVINRPKWAIPWLEDDPGLALPQLWAGRMRRDGADALSYGCTGLIGIHWRTQIISPNISALANAAWNQKAWNPLFGKTLSPEEAIEKSKDPVRDLGVTDFYSDWCKANFGEKAGSNAAEIFIALDGTKKGSKTTFLPRPGDWSGPGGVKPDSILWDQRKTDYKFVDEFEKLSKKVKGKSNIERYSYWLNNFKYLRAIGKFACSTGEVNRLLKVVKKDTLSDRSKYLKTFVDIRTRQIEEFEEIINYLMNTINTNGELGTMANWQQHNYTYYIFIPGKEIEKLLKQNLPAECWLPDKIININRIIVPTLRTTLRSGEDLKLKIIVPAEDVKSVKMFWRHIGEKNYSAVNLNNEGRCVWKALIPSSEISDSFEYYIEAGIKTGSVRFPVTAPERNQTVVVF